MPTPEERNKATVRMFESLIGSGDAEQIERAIDEFVDPDVLMRTPLPLDSTGAEAMKELFGRLHTAFPDLQVEVEDLIAEADKVVARNVVTGTHEGEFMGLAGTGRKVRYDEIFVVRFVDGRIAESWGVVDLASLMRQLGVIPA
jgi:steroid delta-isomerase-like uncharacterized protein